MKKGLLFVAAGVLCLVTQDGLMFALVKPGAAGEAPRGPLWVGFLGWGALVLFVMGAHRILWVPRRDKVTVSPVSRWILSVAVGVALTAGMTFIGGVVAAALRGPG